MSAADAAFAAAIASLQAGRAGDAIASLDAVIAIDPRHIDALHLRARLALQAGDAATAAALLERGVCLAPRANVLRNDLGVALRYLGRDQDAARIFETALLTAQNDAEAWHNLGMTRRKLGDLAGAAIALERAAQFAVRPTSLAALGMVREAQGDMRGALAAFRRAAEIAPDQPDMQRNLAVALGKAGENEAAAAAFATYLRHKPDDAPVLADYGLVLLRMEQRDAAQAALERALRSAPDHVPALRTLASLLAPDRASVLLDRAIALAPDDADLLHERARIALASGQAARAEEGARKALALVPDTAEFLVTLTAALWDQRKMDEARGHLDRALSMAPDIAQAQAFAGGFAQLAGDAEAARRFYARSVELDPANPAAHSNMLFSAQYCDAWDAAAIRAEHESWDRRHGDGLRAHWVASVADPDPTRTLRVGFVSYDFNRHPVGFFTLGLFRALDRAQIEPVCFSTGNRPDDMTHAIRASGAAWHECTGMSDDTLDALIRAERIDILIDLAGHTAFNRLTVFARKPAPVQMSWAGYVGTTGLAAIDWLIADRFHVPPEFASDHRERVLRLPDGYVCYTPPLYAPSVTALPMAQGHAPTFAAFHNPAKMGKAAIALWARVLRELPGSRIMMKYRGLDAGASRARLAASFAAHGVDASLLVIEGAAPHEALLARYGACDIALDSLPYSGGLTTLEALWMGVPVITLPGRRFASRHSLSHLSNVGLAELVARDEDDYVAKAVALARDPARLVILRAGLRGRVAASPLCDIKGFSENFTAAMRQAWRARVLS